jgi:hypothetical protein
MSAIKALAAAQENGLLFSRDGDQLVISGQELPDDLMEMVAANKPDLMRVMVGREAARAAFTSAPPPGCRPYFWAEAAFPPSCAPAGAIWRRSRAGQTRNCTPCRLLVDA